MAGYFEGSMEEISISDADIGERVKIYGTINATEQIVAQRVYVEEQDDWDWEIIDFYVYDSTGEIFVDTNQLNMEGSTDVHSGPHGGQQYWNGDNVSVIGTVRHSTIKGKILWAGHIAQNPDDFYVVTPEWMYGITVLFIISILASVFVGSIGFARNRLHVENLNDFSPKLVPVEDKEDVGKKPFILKKKPWKDFNYDRELRRGVVASYALPFLFIFVLVDFVILILFNWLMNPNPSSGLMFSIDFIGVFIWSTMLTIIIGTLLVPLQIHWCKKRAGESSYSYEVQKSVIIAEEVKQRLIDILKGSSLRFDYEYKETKKGNWQIDFDAPTVETHLRISMVRWIKEDILCIRLICKELRCMQFAWGLGKKIEASLDKYFNEKRYPIYY